MIHRLPSVVIGEVVRILHAPSGEFVMKVDPRTREKTAIPQSFEMSEGGGLVPTDRPATRTIEVGEIVYG